MVPGEKFSSKASAHSTCGTTARGRAAPSGSPSVIACLFWFSIANGKVALLPGSARRRPGSPRGGSILITKAPALAINRVA